MDVMANLPTFPGAAGGTPSAPPNYVVGQQEQYAPWAWGHTPAQVVNPQPSPYSQLTVGGGAPVYAPWSGKAPTPAAPSTVGNVLSAAAAAAPVRAAAVPGFDPMSATPAANQAQPVSQNLGPAPLPQRMTPMPAAPGAMSQADRAAAIHQMFANMTGGQAAQFANRMGALPTFRDIAGAQAMQMAGSRWAAMQAAHQNKQLSDADFNNETNAYQMLLASLAAGGYNPMGMAMAQFAQNNINQGR